MSIVNFTPGPWTYNVNGFKITIGDESTRHAHLAHDYTVAVIEGNSCTDVANARLIAAAPDLLEALQRTLAYLSVHDSQYWLGNAGAIEARKAIAKSKGMNDGLSA